MPTLAAIGEHDTAAAELNARVFGRARFDISHPLVELLRLQLLLREGAWVLPAAVRERFDGTIGIVRHSALWAVEPPRLCHGDLGPDRLLQAGDGRLVARAPASSSYVVGPYDESAYVWRNVARTAGAGPITALSRLRTLVPDSRLPLAASWLLVFTILNELREVVLGREVSPSAMRFCRDFQHLWARGLTPSR